MQLVEVMFDYYVSTFSIKNEFLVAQCSIKTRGLFSVAFYDYVEKMSFFNDIKLRVLSKISNWQHKVFTSGEKLVLVKAVAQAIRVYAMSAFKLPMRLCKYICWVLENVCL